MYIPDSIFLSLSPRPTLFASFKYVGNSFDEDMARMAANPKVQEWWRMTDGMQESPVKGAVGSKDGPGGWGGMEEVFYVE
jgi:L-rhamnose mutarotase